tara:strand:+ start:216 stop:500 length:285 start_codon:yes stop_codon:yes gene_type:complete
VVMLFSVGCAFDKETGNTFPIMDEGKIDFDNPVNILECDSEWFGELHLLDFDVVKNWFADEDLDIEAMLTNDWLDNYCEENPDFDMAMNGIDIY